MRNNQINISISSHFFFRVDTNHAEIVDLLLRHGADPNKIRKDNRISPLHIAYVSMFYQIKLISFPFISSCSKGYKDIVEMLVEAKANIHCALPGLGATSLFNA